MIRRQPANALRQIGTRIAPQRLAIRWRTLIASDSSAALGTVHFTDARSERGEGNTIVGRAHLSGLFVLPGRWGEGVGSALLEAAQAAMRSRGYHSAQLFTATANRRSRIFYERRGWRASDVDTRKDDDLWLVRYELQLTS